MKRTVFSILFALLVILLFINARSKPLVNPAAPSEEEYINKITGIIQPLDTLEAIFVKHHLNKDDLLQIIHNSKDKYNFSELHAGDSYLFETDRNNRILKMQYVMDNSTFLDIKRLDNTFRTEIETIEYEKRIGSLYINIKNNLISSMPNTHREYLKLALRLSEIYAWDIDFLSDIRNGDSVKIILEELWVGNAFSGFGDVLAAEFLNNGRVHKAYKFRQEGFTDYFDDNGKSLKKTLLRSPLKFSRISSHFSKRRLHPILRRYRPHLGVDYAAPAGTPVSSAGNGTVTFSGYKGQNGKMVKIKHRGGFETYYGHLSKIPGGIKQGKKVSQGDIIGYVGMTGLATGPHLDYRIKRNGSFVNPLKVELPRIKAIPGSLKSTYKMIMDSMDTRLVSLTQPDVISSKQKKKSSS